MTTVNDLPEDEIRYQRGMSLAVQCGIAAEWWVDGSGNWIPGEPVYVVRWPWGGMPRAVSEPTFRRLWAELQAFR